MLRYHGHFMDRTDLFFGGLIVAGFFFGKAMNFLNNFLLKQENDKFGLVGSDLCNFNQTFQEECFSLCLRKIQSFTCYMKYK